MKKYNTTMGIRTCKDDNMMWAQESSVFSVLQLAKASTVVYVTTVAY